MVARAQVPMVMVAASMAASWVADMQGVMMVAERVAATWAKAVAVKAMAVAVKAMAVEATAQVLQARAAVVARARACEVLVVALMEARWAVGMQAAEVAGVAEATAPAV